MIEEKISLYFTLGKMNKTRNYFLEKIKQRNLMSKKHKQICLA